MNRNTSFYTHVIVRVFSSCCVLIVSSSFLQQLWWTSHSVIRQLVTLISQNVTYVHKFPALTAHLDSIDTVFKLWNPSRLNSHKCKAWKMGWCTCEYGYAVVQLVQVLRYKPECRGFDSRWDHWLNPSGRNMTQSLTGVPWKSPGGKGGRCVGLTTLPPSCTKCVHILAAGTSWTRMGLSRPVNGQFYKRANIKWCPA